MLCIDQVAALGSIVTAFRTLGICLGLAALQVPQEQVFKARVDLARLDVVVTDVRTGKPVTDLTARDFSVFENGLQQEIRLFVNEPFVPMSEGSPPSAVVRSGASDARSRRVFLFVPGIVGLFEQAGIRGPVRPLEGIIRFIRERLMPQDLVGVIAFNRATDLTTDHEYVAQVVERIKDRHQAITYEILKQGLAEPSLCNDLRPEIQSSIDRLFEMTAPRIHSPRSVVPLLFPTVEFRSLGQTQKCTQWNRLIAGRNLLRVYAGIEYLRPVTGQKHLVVTTHGFFSSSDFYRPAGLWFRDASEEARLAARANDAEIALDVIDTFGTQASQSSVPFDRLSNMNLAALSGGQFSSLKTADDALRQLDASSRHSYLIGYAPSNASLDGKYRNVTVRVTRPGVAVAFRHGYTAQPETPPLDIQDIEASTRLRDAATSDMQQTDIKLDVTASMLRTDAGGRQVRVDVRIDGSRIAFTQNGARREGSLHLLILCGDKDQSVVGRIQHQLGMSLDDEKYHRALTEGMPYSAIVPISGIATSVKVVAYDYASDLLGSKVVTIK